MSGPDEARIIFTLEQARELAEAPRKSAGISVGEEGDKEYARGVRNALMWVLEETELEPFEDDEEIDDGD